MDFIGGCCDETEIQQIENIAKVFVVEERIKDITPRKIITKNQNEKMESSEKLSKENHEIFQYSHIPKLTVKGLI